MNIIAQRFSDSIQRSETNKITMNSIRKTRNMLLAESDWTQLPDNNLSDTKRAEWAAYRQELRNFTDTVDLSNFAWPTKPN